MLPTKGKSKIPKDLSWTVGAKMLSDALEGVPQYKSLRVSFLGYATLSKSEFQKQIKRKEAIVVLSVGFTNIRPGLGASKDLIEMGLYDETWDIIVYPVPKERKAEVREAVCKFGFAAIRKWLTKQRPASWYDGRKRLSLSFDLSRGELITSE